MAKATEPLPGTSDLWEPDISEWVALESTARNVFTTYGYDELRTPIFERTNVFVRSIGDETDVVQKEMYTFEDRGGRSLTLRPEGTAGVMRAIAHRGLSQGEELRVFYLGPMFRGERPAAGRRRQFHQIGVEAVGRCNPAMDVESIAMLMHFLEACGVGDSKLLLNTRGVAEDRVAVAAAFEKHFAPQSGGMCDDCQRRLRTNIWRILDCKEEQCQDVIEQAPRMADLVSKDTRDYFTSVCDGLDALNIPYEIAPRLVRGLDYYAHTVFEVVHHGLGAQDAIAGGGRYVVSPPGCKNGIEGVGFAVGVERLVLARQSLERSTPADTAPDIYIVSLGSDAINPGLCLAQELRRGGCRVVAETAGRSMKAQLRTANKLGAKLALIRGESELSQGTVVGKDMGASIQEEFAADAALGWVTARLERR